MVGLVAPILQWGNQTTTIVKSTRQPSYDDHGSQTMATTTILPGYRNPNPSMQINAIACFNNGHQMFTVRCNFFGFVCLFASSQIRPALLYEYSSLDEAPSHDVGDTVPCPYE